MSDAALFVMPRASTAWVGAEAMWITVAGWAAAARAAFGEGWVVTPDRTMTPEETLELTRPRETRRKVPGRLRKAVPAELETAVKDVRLLRRSLAMPAIDEDGPWRGHDLAFVWEQHDLFRGAGARFARRHGIPFVTYVHAPQVWETAKWGVRRPVWGRLIEEFSETRSLVEADLVACVSDEVARQLAAMGVPERRILVSPMSVDSSRFSPSVLGEDVRARYGLEQRFVFGWTGSFRKFHGLDILVRAFAHVHDQIPSTTLFLVGDGQERAATEALARELGIAEAVVFPGSVSHLEVPAHVAAMDACIVSARDADSFHYSPLKLREYALCGKPTIAPRAGEMNRLLVDGRDALLVAPGDVGELSQAMMRLAGDEAFARAVAERGMASLSADGTWDVQVRRVVQALDLLDVRRV